MRAMLKADLYRSLLGSINTEFDAELEAFTKGLESRRRKAIEALNEAWPKMGGSEEDLVLSVAEVADSSPVKHKADGQRQEVAPTRNGSSPKRTIPTATIREEVQNALLGAEGEIITQGYLRERILRKYPDAKVGSLAPAISRTLSQLTERGELELVERGVAGAPHKYRKKRGQAEEARQARETEETLLRSGP